jgi:dTDP-4-dehydrorhamnose reductase
VFSEYGNNFVRTMARLLSQGKSLKVVNDQTGCPTYAGDLAIAVMAMLDGLKHTQANDIYGIYNFCNEGAVTWYDFALEIATQLKVAPDITPVSTAEYGAKAPRPAYSVLNTQKIRSTFGLETPHWHDGLVKTLKSL